MPAAKSIGRRARHVGSVIAWPIRSRRHGTLGLISIASSAVEGVVPPARRPSVSDWTAAEHILSGPRSSSLCTQRRTRDDGQGHPSNNRLHGDTPRRLLARPR